MRLGALFTRRAVDALAVALVAFALLEAALGTPRLGHAALALVATLPLLLHRRFPLVASGVVFAVVAGLAVARPEAVADGVSATLLALLLAFWVAGASAERSHAVAGAAMGLAALAVLAQRARADESEADALLPGDVVEVGDFYIDTVFLFVLAGGLSLAAYALQRRSRRAGLLEERAERLERERGERERAAVVDERRRIARDLHDVVAHSVSVMTVQAGAARLLLAEQPERAREPLLAVEETGRQALGELRRLLGILRREQADTALAPQPSLARLQELLDEARAAGLPVQLSLQGQTRPLPAGVDLAAYRIVQEALTNARKHAGPANAHVLVRYADEALELEVTDDGHTPANGDSSDGHGLVGMRERAALYGGTLHAGPRAQGGYTVHALLPLEASRP
jgi:signal transduction histidine kinase